ncbi:galactonate dehydratase [Ligilactobacillus pobuzihii]|uniref:galactonate dehydratase n=1 Tax=Ligilactobacillus pobuzihii TaxID=449659 RepID=UPI0019D201B6|nr:galactonate dehydratase [Ligilactobacillus pobuzihii]MBN7274996.1 galactonate dehydratase [Ligilactobacillus pobuzihii]
MKIKSYETFQVPPRWLFLKVETDEGISGWGEPVIEGRAATVDAAVHELMDSLIGTDPARIEDTWEKMYRSGFYRGGPVLMSAIAGIDQALWDIKGKTLGQPVYQLMGGAVRDKIKVYSWIGGDRPSNVGAAALERKNAGFTAIKMNATEELQIIDSYEKVQEVVERVKAIRDSCGPYFGIAVDFHGRVHKPMAKVLAKELEPYNLMFIEEPVLPENDEDLCKINELTKTPIATGERRFTRWEFKELLESGNADIIQPDLSHAGGITECKKIASMAEAYDVGVAFHCPLGPIDLAAALQVDATVYNAFIQEQSLGIHYNKTNDLLDYIKNPEIFEYDDGFVKIPQLPGLGVEVNEELVREKAKENTNWHNPVWRHEDGTIAEW